ncbi:13969_t:CDS:2 [Funneliformis caledonium]|uniref:13969_t:CDS:1 n=1 Tax=Funneliformis caledonium TaxID=1117310 RepID=A0A9N9GUR8_9GLOM|nr:13969_t:CDS:2 [Funneliformis caledonium]
MPPLETFPNLTFVCLEILINSSKVLLNITFFLKWKTTDNKTSSLRRSAEDDDEIMTMQELEDEHLLLIKSMILFDEL